jgi:hypothetical protein
MRTVSEIVDIQAPAETVFAYVDDIRNVGWHMTERSSMPMLGSRLELDILSEQSTGLGATYRYSGRMLGLSLDVSEPVTRYVPSRSMSSSLEIKVSTMSSMSQAESRRCFIEQVGIRLSSMRRRRESSWPAVLSTSQRIRRATGLRCAARSP